MARVKFSVQHFVACLNAGWDGMPGPKTSRTLERVGYLYIVAPNTEFPCQEFEFWLYARFYRVGELNGTTGKLSIKVYWHDAPEGLRYLDERDLGSVRFSDRQPVVNTAWPLQGFLFPGQGLYEFQLTLERNRPWGNEDRLIRQEFIRIEKKHEAIKPTL